VTTRTSFLLGTLALLGGTVRPALAADAGAGALLGAASSSASSSPGVVLAEPARVYVKVGAEGLSVDEAAVRAAIERELARGSTQGSTTGRAENAEGAAGRVIVRLERVEGRSLSVSYQPASGRAVSRTVRAPERADELPEVTALLVGNLARDEAGELLAGLGSADAVPTASNTPASAAAVTPSAAPAEAPPLPFSTVNVSVFAPFTLRANTEQQRFAFEFGLFYSHIGGLSGMALTGLGVLHVDGPAQGLELAGVGYLSGPGVGVRAATLFGVSHGRFDGIGLSAGALLHDGAWNGAEIAMGTSLASGALDGAQLSVGYNQAAEVHGVQADAGANLARGPVHGAQLTAGANLAEGAVHGVQGAGTFNWTAGPLTGAQLSSGVNVAQGVEGLQLSLVNVGGNVRGAQIGIVNIANEVSGVQLGLVNVADEVKGQSLAFVPYSRAGKTQIVTWYDSSQPLNLGVRFHSGALYVMPTFAYEPGPVLPWSQSAKSRYAPGVSLGGTLPFDRAFVDLDVNYSERSTGLSYNTDRIHLRYRALAGWQCTSAFAVFLGGGLHHELRTANGAEVQLKPELSVGVQIL
jgi:hypothetical protein